MLGLDMPSFVKVLPNELPVLAVSAEQPDLLLRLVDDAIVDLEFQLTTTGDDLHRFYRYHYAISETYSTRVFTVVIYGGGITRADEELDRGSVRFQVHSVCLGQRDGDALVARLRAHASAGERSSMQEHLEAILLPLMGRQRPLPDLLPELACASAVLPGPERVNVLGTLVGLAYNYLEPEMAQQLLEVLRMANVLEQLLEESLSQGRAEGRAEGLATGLMEARRQDVLRLLDRRFGPLTPAVAARQVRVGDPDRLNTLFETALDVQSLDEFLRALDDAPGA